MSREISRCVRKSGPGRHDCTGRSADRPPIVPGVGPTPEAHQQNVQSQRNGSGADSRRCDRFPALDSPAQPFGLAENLIHPAGDDLLAALLPLAHQLFELLDLRLERLDLEPMPLLPEVELFAEVLGELGPDLASLGVGRGELEAVLDLVRLVGQRRLLRRELVSLRTRCGLPSNAPKRSDDLSASGSDERVDVVRVRGFLPRTQCRWQRSWPSARPLVAAALAARERQPQPQRGPSEVKNANVFHLHDHLRFRGEGVSKQSVRSDRADRFDWISRSIA